MYVSQVIMLSPLSPSLYLSKTERGEKSGGDTVNLSFRHGFSVLPQRALANLSTFWAASSD